MRGKSRILNRITKRIIAAVALPAVVAMFGTASAFAGALFTTDMSCQHINDNIYNSKTDVYLNGGPGGTGSELAANTTYCIKVQSPEGADLNATECRVTTDGDGNFACFNLFACTGFNDTDNPGGEYLVMACPLGENADCTFRPDEQCKSDNFKVRENMVHPCCLPEDGGCILLTCKDCAKALGECHANNSACAEFECGGGGQQGCILSGPIGTDLGCNPTSEEIPTCDSVTVGGVIVPGSFECAPVDTVDGCAHSLHIVASAMGDNGIICTYDQTFTWKEDTGPVFAGCNNIIAKAPDVGSCSKNVTYATPTATDCSGANLTVTCTPASPVSVTIGTPVTVTCTTTTTTGDDGACGVQGSCSFTVTLERCPLTVGYWKTHATSTWPCTPTLGADCSSTTPGTPCLNGNSTYTRTELQAILNQNPGTGTTANALLILADQLIAAKLNVCNIAPCGTDAAGFGTCANAMIAQADCLIGCSAKIIIYDPKKKTYACPYVKASSTLGQQMIAVAKILDNCNNSCTATQ